MIAMATAEELAARTDLTPGGPATSPVIVAASDFSLSVQLQPVVQPSATGTNDAVRRVLAAAEALKRHRISSKGAISRLFNGQKADGRFNMKYFQAGYGTVFEADLLQSRGRNGTAIEEPTYLFVKGLLAF